MSKRSFVLGWKRVEGPVSRVQGKTPVVRLCLSTLDPQPLSLLWVMLCSLFALAGPLAAGDWPAWRAGAARQAATPEPLSAQLHLQWTRELPRQRPAWPESQTNLQFDRFYEPVVLGKRMFVGSTVNDSITAYDTDSGAELWRFSTEAPVRFAPVAADGRVYAASDDGFLYCLDAKTGRQLWKVRGGPSDRRILGNGRLVSTWPPRTGPVLADGVVYFTAGIWPSMGVFIHAVDAQTGRILWTNSDSGSRFTVHPHRAASFGSVVPQGYLAVSGDYLIVPGGRSLPAVLDRHTGELIHFQFGGKSSGGFAVTAAENLFTVGGELFRLENGDSVGSLGTAEVKIVSGDLVIGNERPGGPIFVHSLADALKQTTTTDRRGNKQRKLAYRPEKIRRLTADGGAPTDVHMKAGHRLYAGDVNRVAAFELPMGDSAKQSMQPVWSAPVNGRVGSMLAADGKLFVVTEEGRIYCFGPEERDDPPTLRPPDNAEAASTAEAETAERILDLTDQRDGYAAAFGLKDGRLIEELARQSELFLIGIDPDAEKVASIRRRLDDAGLYGRRTVLHVGDPQTFRLPPYLLNLIVTEDPAAAPFSAAGFPEAVYQSLRPYGGVACLQIAPEERRTFSKAVTAANLARAELTHNGEFTLLARTGSLPGAGVWTHQYADASNSVVSKESLVKVPLGVLWFGGPSNDRILPRHGHGPSPQVAGGRLFIEGPDILRAVDVYTGRLLWEKELQGIGRYYNTTRHFAGAGEIGSNYVSLPDAVYVVYGTKILELDAADGKIKKEFTLQAEDGGGHRPKGGPPRWGFVAASGDLLVAASSPVEIKTAQAESSRKPAVIPAGFQPLIQPNDRWQYVVGTPPEENWHAVDFDDTGWLSGRAGFGYGDDDDRTLLENMHGVYTSVYLRKVFDKPAEGIAEALALMVNFDDAFIAYLNGREIARHNVRSRSGARVELAGAHEARGHELYTIRDIEKLLRTGRNVLAIEGHNRGLRSSDFTLDPYLLFKPAGTQTERPQRLALAENSADAQDPAPLDEAFQPVPYSSASRQLAVFNRHTGKLLWKRTAQYNFRHNCIVAAAGKVFCIDGLSPEKVQQLKRRGIDAAGKSRLLALDARTGREIWTADKDVTGTFLNYSDTHDVLLQAGSAYRDRAGDEVDRGMVAYRGESGEVLWKDLRIKHGGPCLLWRDKIITNGGGGYQLELLTGKPTGWTYSRMYGCNTAVGCRNLLTFRSGAAGFFDLAGDSGTGNLGGFRSSCTSNLIAADGVLSAPDYTRTCSCAYQLQTSLALVHMPEADLWTFNDFSLGDKPLKQIGINLGAPGDRRAPNETLWFEYPLVGGPSPEFEVAFTPHRPPSGKAETKGGWFRRHPSLLEGSGLNWVAASGVENIRSLAVSLDSALQQADTWTVRLHFAEPQEAKPGERVFSVALQNKTVLSDFDIARETGPTRRALVKEFTGIPAGSRLQVTLTPAAASKHPAVLCGVEVVVEE